MPSYKDAFPSKFMKAEDVGARKPTLTIDHVDYEEVGSGSDKRNKLVVHWVEPTYKPNVLNATNAETLAELAGTDDFEHWGNVRVQLFVIKTQYQGKRVDGIRFGAAPAASARPSRPGPAPAAPRPRSAGRPAARPVPPEAPLDDDVVFDEPDEPVDDDVA